MHKLFLLLLFTFFITFSISAQVLNGSFENWTNGNPDSWTAVTNIQSLYMPITKSATAHSGSSSLRGEVLSYLGTPITPMLQSGVNSAGFSISQRYATFSGYYQFTSVSSDTFFISCLLYKGTTPMAVAVKKLNPASAWTQFSLTITYISGDTPDKAVMNFYIASVTTGGAHVGSFFLLDDVNLSGTATSVNDRNIIPARFSLEQNYPNPFNPSTTIKYDLADNSFVSLKIYNALGGEEASLINKVVPAGSHEILFNAAGLKSGIYFYTLKAGNFVQTRKMILMK